MDCHKPAMKAIGLLFAAVVLALGGCCSVSPTASTVGNEQSAIRAVLDQQVREWNLGNLAGFMETYARADSTRFASGGNVNLGWQAVFDRYKAKYGDPAGMGVTTFSGLEVTMLGPDTAMAFGRWHQKGSKGEGSGLFTLILRKQVEGWRIIHDHTSAAQP
jgi:ketosteroid isomerase-like protein